MKRITVVTRWFRACNSTARITCASGTALRYTSPVAGVSLHWIQSWLGTACLRTFRKPQDFSVLPTSKALSLSFVKLKLSAVHLTVSWCTSPIMWTLLVRRYDSIGRRGRRGHQSLKGLGDVRLTVECYFNVTVASELFSDTLTCVSSFVCVKKLERFVFHGHVHVWCLEDIRPLHSSRSRRTFRCTSFSLEVQLVTACLTELFWQAVYVCKLSSFRDASRGALICVGTSDSTLIAYEKAHYGSFPVMPGTLQQPIEK